MGFIQTPMSKFLERDISWLSFNARVLQEANDTTNSLRQRIRFLGIFSNNLDEFFRVRVATLKRLLEVGDKKSEILLAEKPNQVLEEIQTIVLNQQNEFNRIWNDVRKEMRREKIFLVDEKHLNPDQKMFVANFFDREVRNNIIPLMVEGLQKMPYLKDRRIYLGVVMQNKHSAYDRRYALIEIPSGAERRFIQLPNPEGEKHIILIEDVIRFNLPVIFSMFGFTEFTSHIFKVTKDAEIDLDNDVTTSFIQKLERGVKNRRKGKTVRFVYDKQMDTGLLEYLIKRLNLKGRDNLIPGGRIHNFRHFMDFPDVFQNTIIQRPPIVHPLLRKSKQVTDVVLKQDVMLHFPYHTFNHLIDFLREAAIDPNVISIQITAYRLASNSKIINALINAARNGKQVAVMIELKARFDEEANLLWKERLEEEGVEVLISSNDMKVHAKVCLIKKRKNKKIIEYGFVSTGNLNEQTAHVYADHCLLTANPKIIADLNLLFSSFRDFKNSEKYLKNCNTLIVSPVNMRKKLIALIDHEIKNAKAGKTAGMVIKLNSLSDVQMIRKLYEAVKHGVTVKMIVRGIFCAVTNQPSFHNRFKAISIVDQFLEHARVFIFENGGKKKVYISSADWMNRNLDYRVEVTSEITNPKLKQELLDIIAIQLSDNVKARLLDEGLKNIYVKQIRSKQNRSQVSTYNYLQKKSQNQKAIRLH